MSIISQSTGIDTVFGTNADIRLEMGAVNEIQLVGVAGTSKRIWVRDIAIPVYNTITLEPDSASEYIITGSGIVTKGSALSGLSDNDYDDYGLHYVYFCNDNDCWNFDGYDRRRQLIISATPPIEEGGYLHDWGDGANARHVGWIALNSSRQFDDELGLASVFNPTVEVGRFGNTVATWVAMTEYQAHTEFNDMLAKIVIPKNWSIHCAHCICLDNVNATALYIDFWIWKDSTGLSNTHIRAANASAYQAQSAGTAVGSFKELDTIVRTIKSTYNINQASGGTPRYFDKYTYLVITRIPPQNSSGFTRQFTQEYEAIARTVNGGRIEYVSDTEIQWQPYINGSIGLYNGLNWEIVTPATTPSAANTAVTISGGALAVDTNYDVFATYVSSTELELEFQEWATASGRYADLVYFEGIKVYADTAEGRMKRWIGAIRMDDDSGAKFKDNLYQRYVANYYNTINKVVKTYNSLSSNWSYNSATIRELNGGTNQTRGYFICLYNTKLYPVHHQVYTVDTTYRYDCGIGLNDTTAFTDPHLNIQNGSADDLIVGGTTAVQPIMGLNYITQVERAMSGSVDVSSWGQTAAFLSIDI